MIVDELTSEVVDRPSGSRFAARDELAPGGRPRGRVQRVFRGPESAPAWERPAFLTLLAATAVLSFFLGDSLQAIIIGVILLVSVGLSFTNEFRAERVAASLHSSVRHYARVRRDGQSSSVKSPTSSPAT